MGISLEKLLRQLGINPGDIAVDVPVGSVPFYGHPIGDTEGSQSFSVANGTNLDQRTSFVVGSVIVDNSTSSYLNVPDATKDGVGRWVPPGTGAAMPILGHISRARINWTAPPSKNQIAPVAGESAQVIFLATAIPPGFGIAAPSNQSLPYITPNQPSLNIFTTLAASGGSITLVSAVAGKTIYVFECNVEFDAAGTGDTVSLTDTNGTAAHKYPSTATPNAYKGYGTPFAVGVGLKLVNSATNTMTPRGSLIYSQA